MSIVPGQSFQRTKVGVESPWRLYQAMVAGSTLKWCRDPPEFEVPSRQRGVLYAPSPDGRLTLNVPWRGECDALEPRYRGERVRIGAS